jgi:hypothetical protein
VSSADPLAPASPGADAHEALIQFLYRAPIGLVQTSLDGAVDMLNPMASSLLATNSVNPPNRGQTTVNCS